MLIIGGGAKSIGLYAAGLAVAHGAGVADYLDDYPGLGGRSPSPSALKHLRRVDLAPPRGSYDIVVEASSRAAGVR